MGGLTLVSKIDTGFSGDSAVKNLTAADVNSIPGSGRPPGEGHGNPLQYSCLENPMDKRTLVGFSPWGYKELDMAKTPSTSK